MRVESLLLCRDADAVRVLRRVCDELHIHALVVTAAPEAQAILARRKFDAVVADCDDMPGSHELLRDLRASSCNRAAIVFALLNGVTTVPAAFSLGANFVLDKPLYQERTLRSFQSAHGLMLRERRRYFRHEVNIPLVLDVKGLPYQATITNLSEGGMAVRTAQELPVSQTVRLTFTLPGSSRPIEGQGELAWNNGERAGIRLLFITDRVKAELATWLSRTVECEQRAPLFINGTRDGAKAES